MTTATLSEIEVLAENVHVGDRIQYGEDDVDHVGLVTRVEYYFNQLVLLGVRQLRYPLILPYSRPELKGADNVTVFRDVGDGC